MNKEIKLDLSNEKMNINEQLIQQGYKLSEKHEKIALNEIEKLKNFQEQKLISEEEISQGINNLMDFIILNAKEI